MVSQIVIAGINASGNAIDFAPPIVNGLVGWWHIGGNAALSVPNLAAPGDVATVAGTPTFAAGYATFEGNVDYMQTTIPDMLDCTYLVVARSTDTFVSGHVPLLMGCYNAIGAEFYGCNIQISGTPDAPPNATVVVRGGRQNGSGGSVMASVQLTVNGINNWKCLVGVVTSGITSDARRVYNKTDGTSAVAAASSARILHPNLKWQLGAAATSLILGVCDTAVHAIYNRVLSVDEIEELYQFVKYRLATLYGIVC